MREGCPVKLDMAARIVYVPNYRLKLIYLLVIKYDVRCK